MQQELAECYGFGSRDNFYIFLKFLIFIKPTKVVELKFLFTTDQETGQISLYSGKANFLSLPTDMSTSVMGGKLRFHIHEHVSIWPDLVM